MSAPYQQRVQRLLQAFSDHPSMILNWSKPIPDLDLSFEYQLNRVRHTIALLIKDVEPELVAELDKYLECATSAFVWKVLVVIVSGMFLAPSGKDPVLMSYLNKYYEAFTKYRCRHYYTMTFRCHPELTREEILKCSGDLQELVYYSFNCVHDSVDLFKQKIIRDGKNFVIIGTYPNLRTLRVYGVMATNKSIPGIGQQILDELVKQHGLTTRAYLTLITKE